MSHIRAAALLLVVPLLPGCVLGPGAPPDLVLRELAGNYVRQAVRYPLNPAVRAQAIEAAAEVLKDDSRLLVREGLKDEHAGVRFAACMALGKLGDTGSIGSIRRLANGPDPNVRVGAYFALEKMGLAYYREQWADTLRRHEDPAVRSNAAMALGQLGDKGVIPLLRVAATTDDHEGVRLQASEALALLGDQDAINRFIHDAFGGVGFRQSFALLALGRAADPRVVGYLRTRLEGAPYPEARLAAARSLGTQGYGDGYDLAVKWLNWNEPDTNLPDDPPENQRMRVQSMAALALGDIADRRALPQLKRRMEQPDDPRVQLACATAILKILSKTPAL